MKKRIVSLVLVVSICISLICVMPVTANTDWCEDYSMLLNKNYYNINSYYWQDGTYNHNNISNAVSFYDIDKNGIPELFFVKKKSEGCAELCIYTFDNGFKLIYSDDQIHPIAGGGGYYCTCLGGCRCKLL